MSIFAPQKARAATSEEERAKRDLAEAEAKLKTLEEAAKAVRTNEACCLPNDTSLNQDGHINAAVQLGPSQAAVPSLKAMHN